MKVTCCCSIQAIRAFLLTLLRKDATGKVRFFKGIEIFYSHMSELSAIGVTSDLRAHQKDVKIDKYQLRLEQTYDPGKANYTAHSVWRLCYPLPGLQYQPALHPVHT
ncbi:hypothetical protein CIAM_22600 [Citrobacter amalonaticus]|nr:hypothetical protein CIAM_22600 [Citrobacter amalonaticus]GJK85426.1 hypothetical protein TUM17567_17210 [Citrobacter amalonaticus]